MIYKMELDEDSCTECGRCQVFVPELLDTLETRELFINTNNLNVNWPAVNGAMAACQAGALRLVEHE